MYGLAYGLHSDTLVKSKASSANRLQGQLLVIVAALMVSVQLIMEYDHVKPGVQVKKEMNWKRVVPRRGKYEEVVAVMTRVLGEEEGQWLESTTTTLEISECHTYVSGKGLMTSSNALLLAHISEECGLTADTLLTQSTILASLLFE